MKLGGGALVAAAVLLITACGGAGPSDLALPALATDGELDVATLSGPVVLNLWATWCVPCTDELPDFQRASEDLPGVRFVGVDETGFGEDGASVEFLADLGVTYEQFVDPDGALMAEFDITELPATLIIDADGGIAWRHQGRVTYDELVERLAEG